MEENQSRAKAIRICLQEVKIMTTLNYILKKIVDTEKQKILIVKA